MGIGLVAIDLRRVVNFFLLNRAAPARWLPAPFKGPWWKLVSYPVSAVVVFAMLYSSIEGASKAMKNTPTGRPPLFGIYEVESFARDGEVIPPLATDGTRWQRMIVGRPGTAAVTMMNGDRIGYVFEPDTDSGTVSMADYRERDRKFAMQFSVPAEGRFVLEGALGDSELRIEFTRKGPEDYLLMNRGFHWISERPYNR